MKKLQSLSLVMMLIAAMFLYSCDNAMEETTPSNSIIPENFSIDIPNSLSNTTIGQASGTSNARVNADDTLRGNHIYQHLNTFIHVGEKSAEVVQGIMRGIRKHSINKAMSLSFQSEEDGRIKNLDVIEGSAFDGQEWQYELLITDSESESATDGGKALQIFWNTNPVKGIAILKPYNINRKENGNSGEAVFRIDYSEAGEHGYDAHMIVQIANLPLPAPYVAPFAMHALKMFVGRKGDVVDVSGNSDHPNGRLFTDNTGYGWAFVASGKKNEDYGVAEVGLPYSSIDSPNRDVLLGTYAMKAVFKREIMEAYPNVDQQTLDAYLSNTEAPGFFANGRFVKAGAAPDARYNELVNRITNLSPYNPKAVANLSISFK